MKYNVLIKLKKKVETVLFSLPHWVVIKKKTRSDTSSHAHRIFARIESFKNGPADLQLLFKDVLEEYRQTECFQAEKRLWTTRGALCGVCQVNFFFFIKLIWSRNTVHLQQIRKTFTKVCDFSILLKKLCWMSKSHTV